MLETRGSGSPPTTACPTGTELTPCTFCRQPLAELGCNHLFCSRCRVFKCAPPLLQWETAGGAKTSRRKPGGSNAAWTRYLEAPGFSQLPGSFKPLEFGKQSVLPRTGCPTPTCSGNPTFLAAPRLTGPKFFPTTWAESPEPLVSPFTEPVEQRAFSPCPPQSSSFGLLETEVFQSSESSGMRHPVRPGGEDAAPTLGPRTRHRTGEHANPRHPLFAPRRFDVWTMASTSFSRRRRKAAMRPHAFQPLGFHSQTAHCCKGAQHQALERPLLEELAPCGATLHTTTRGRGPHTSRHTCAARARL